MTSYVLRETSNLVIKTHSLCRQSWTFIAAVDVPDLVPAILSDDISQRSRVLRSYVQLIGDLLATRVNGHPRRNERHSEGGAVRLDSVKSVGHVSRVERENTSRHHLTNYTIRYQADLSGS